MAFIEDNAAEDISVTDIAEVARHPHVAVHEVDASVAQTCQR